MKTTDLGSSRLSAWIYGFLAKYDPNIVEFNFYH